jgi:hypothetical protein
MKPELLLGMALGTFLCNWLIVPLFGFRSFRDGFWVGLIAAGLILLILVVTLVISNLK